jgi:hypothetical protein
MLKLALNGQKVTNYDLFEPIYLTIKGEIHLENRK